MITITDLGTQQWNSFIDIHEKTQLLEVILENDNYKDSILMNRNEAENIAAFCRGFLLAWEYAQNQEGV